MPMTSGGFDIVELFRFFKYMRRLKSILARAEPKSAQATAALVVDPAADMAPGASPGNVERLAPPPQSKSE
jgi:hypothetical protein